MTAPNAGLESAVESRMAHIGGGGGRLAVAWALEGCWQAAGRLLGGTGKGVDASPIAWAVLLLCPRRTRIVVPTAHAYDRGHKARQGAGGFPRENERSRGVLECLQVQGLH